MHATSRSFTDFAAHRDRRRGHRARWPTAPRGSATPGPVATRRGSRRPVGGRIGPARRTRHELPAAISSSTARSSVLPLVQLAVTVPIAVLQTPGTFVTALQVRRPAQGDRWRCRRVGDRYRGRRRYGRHRPRRHDRGAQGMERARGRSGRPAQQSSLPPPVDCRESSPPSRPPAGTPSRRSTASRGESDTDRHAARRPTGRREWRGSMWLQRCIFPGFNAILQAWVRHR